MTRAEPLTVLVTGATGVVGSDLTDALAKTQHDVVGVARRPPKDSAVVAWNMGQAPPPAELRRPWDVIVNCVGRTDLAKPERLAWRANVETIAGLHEMAGPQTRLVHLSTAFAPGRHGDVSHPERSAYRNSYEWSKAAGEREVRHQFPDACIVRPPLIVGRRDDGSIARYKGIYQCFRAIAAGLAPVVIAVPSCQLEIVSVTDVTRCLSELITAPDAGGLVVLGRGRDAPRVQDLVDIGCNEIDHARQQLGLDPIKRPKLVTRATWARLFPAVGEVMSPVQRGLVELLGVYADYFSESVDIQPNVLVDDVEAPFGLSLRHWLERRPAIVRRVQRAWSGPDASDPPVDGEG